MDYSDLIDELLEGYVSLAPVHPRHEYYRRRLLYTIQHAYDLGEISSQEANIRTVRKKTIDANYDMYNLYKVFKEYQTLVNVGNNILSVVDVQDILFCRRLCYKMLELRDKGMIVKLGVDKVIALGCKNLYNNCSEAYNKKSFDNTFYRELDFLLKSLAYMRERSTLLPIANIMGKEVVKWKKELVELNKEYFYLPPIASSVTTDLHYYEDDEVSIDKHPEFYMTYFEEKLTAEALELLFNVDADFLNKKSALMAKIEDLPLQESDKHVLRITLNSVFKNYGTNDDPVDVILNLAYDKLDYLVRFQYDALVTAVDIAEEFCNIFSKTGLIRYALMYADISSKSQGNLLPPDVYFDSILRYYLDILCENEVITKEETIALREHYRRSNI